MKAKFFVALCIALFMCSCSKEDATSESKKSINEHVVVSDDGTASGNHIFSAVDDKTFYLDYILYKVKDGHLVVCGYDNLGLKNEANIVSSIAYKGNTYEVLEIGDDYNSPFYKLTRLTSIVLPSSVTSIGSFAFSGCTGLTSIEIPSSVTSIDEFAFHGCTSVSFIKVDQGNNVYDSRESCNAIIESKTNCLIKACNNTRMPNSINSIGEYAFRGCVDLASIEIPSSVTYIGKFAFSGCPGLTTIHVLCQNPPSLISHVYSSYVDDDSSLYRVYVYSFDPSVLSTAKLYVPKGTKSKYAAADGWRYFKNIVEE